MGAYLKAETGRVSRALVLVAALVVLTALLAWCSGIGHWSVSREFRVQLGMREVVDVLSSGEFIAETSRASAPWPGVTIDGADVRSHATGTDMEPTLLVELVDSGNGSVLWLLKRGPGESLGEWRIACDEHEGGTWVKMIFRGDSRGPLGVANPTGAKFYSGWAGRLLYECEQRLTSRAEEPDSR
jgi:hypothetical protein